MKREAERFQETGGDADLKIEFISFCRLLLLLLKSGQVEEVKAELEKIIEQNGQ